MENGKRQGTPNVGRRSTLWSLGLVAGLLLIGPPAAVAQCGAVNQKPCYSLWNLIREGRLAAADATGPCPQGGDFYPFVGGGTCYSCPAGYINIPPFDITAHDACVGIAGETTGATRVGEKTLWNWDCPGDQFYGVGFSKGPGCYVCPDGFGPAPPPLDPDDVAACVRITAGVTRAIYHGQGVVGCAEGLVDIKGTCLKKGDCGGGGQRPCLLGERLPSCDEGFREDFKQGVCVALRPHETPFLGGVASLAEYYGDVIEGTCVNLFRQIDLPIEDDLGVGLNCGVNIFGGFVCAAVRDLSQASYADKVNMLHEIPYGLSTEIGKGYRDPRCAGATQGEVTGPATRHGDANGLDCPSGQFWDPNGGCYTCPQGMIRSLEPIDDATKACFNPAKGELRRVVCAMAVAVETAVEAPLECTVDVVQNGEFFQQPITRENLKGEVCLQTGKLGYTIVALGAEIGGAVATGNVAEILAAIGRGVGGIKQGYDLTTLYRCADQSSP